MLCFAVISFIIWFLFYFGVLVSNHFLVNLTLLTIPLFLVFLSISCLYREGRGGGYRYLFFFSLAVFWLGLELVTGYKSKVLLPILIVLSLCYYDSQFVCLTYVCCVMALLASVWCNANLYQQTGLLDLNLAYVEGSYELPVSGYLYDEIIGLNPSSKMLFLRGLRLTFLPNLIFLSVILVLTMIFLRYNLKTILRGEDLAAQEANQRLELADMRTKVILSQVKPHFVYNTLSSIAFLCSKDSSRAKELTLDFSDYLRNNLDSLSNYDNSVCSFSKEIAHIQCYLRIEQVRFDERLKVEYHLDSLNFQVPMLSIQPIVENAVKHGVSEKVAGGTVVISSYETEKAYLIVVEDDGVGFDLEKEEKDGREHIGLDNIRKRISLFGGEVFLESTPGIGTKVTVTIPKTEEKQ